MGPSAWAIAEAGPGHLCVAALELESLQLLIQFAFLKAYLGNCREEAVEWQLGGQLGAVMAGWEGWQSLNCAPGGRAGGLIPPVCALSAQCVHFHSELFTNASRQLSP